MAEAHKVPSSSSGGGDSSGLIMFIVKILVVVVVILIGFALMVRNPATTISFIYFLQWLQLLSVIVIIGGIITTIMMMRRFTPLNIALGEGYGAKYKPPTDKPSNETAYSGRMTQVESHIESNSEAEWKLAVIEMDGILRDVLKDNGYLGDTIAEQLKAAETRPFNTFQNAWDAHKVRNRIAHEGVSFTIDKHEAKRVYGLYKSVFQEFKIL